MKKIVFLFVLTLFLAGLCACARQQPAQAALPGGLTQVDAVLEPAVLVDNDDIRVSVTAYDASHDMGPAFTLELVNKTAETLYFTLEDVSVNDVMRDPLWGETVPAGQNVSSLLYWLTSDLVAGGIHYIEEVEATLWVYDAADYSNEDTLRQEVRWSLANSGAEVPPAEEREFAGGINDIELFSGAGVRAEVKDFTTEGEWGPSLVFYLQNETDAVVMYTISSVCVNGIELTPYWSADVRAGKVAYSRCYLWEDELADNEISEVETVSFIMTARTFDTWELLDAVEIAFSVKNSGEVLQTNIPDLTA